MSNYAAEKGSSTPLLEAEQGVSLGWQVPSALTGRSGPQSDDEISY